MSGRRFTVDSKWLERNVLASPDVRKALDDKAKRLAPIVRRIALKEGDERYAASVRVEQGTRPGVRSPTHLKRPYARVVIGDETALEKEYGSIRYPKKGFLRRAVSELG